MPNKDMLDPAEALISIIVPVYNVKNYFKECVDSLISQSYVNLEIILIDDGSTDGSSEMCDEFAAQDSRIKVVHKVNGGLSSARNCGLDCCSGSYLAFVDSDDILHLDFFTVLMNEIEDADICISNFQEFYDKAELIFENSVKSGSKKYKAEEVNRNLYGKEFDLLVIIACSKLYKREIWSDLRFPEGKLHEDEFVVHKVLDNARWVAMVDSKLYYYRKRLGSITATLTLKNVEDTLEALRSRILYYEQKGWKDQLRRTRSVERAVFLNPIVTSSFPLWKDYGIVDILKDNILVGVKILLLIKKVSPYLYHKIRVYKGWT